ncbi:MAG: hypothetical protein COA97_05205 [Flavobacteriales bacterium]|nr:MAG: hypothetical protein COA97_05205 [Flavobacteriales bacterium]
MKLIIVIGMHEHQDQLDKLFKESGIPIFSKVDVKGFKSGNKQADLSNWFGGGTDPNLSIMFFAFVPKQNAESILEKVKGFNSEENRIAPLHAFQLPVEKIV